MENTAGPDLIWQRQERTMTLEGETVLSYVLSWPERADCARLTAYYRQLARAWKDRWERQLYPLACLELVRSRERSQVFRPWNCELTGEMPLCTAEVVSLVLCARENGGWGRGRTVLSGCTWRLRDGTPLPLSMLVPPEYRGRKKLLRALGAAAEQCRQEGGCLLDRELDPRLVRAFCPDNVWLEGEALAAAFPQCALAPAGEGCPVLRVPLAPGNIQSREKSSSFRALKSVFTGRGGVRFMGS